MQAKTVAFAPMPASMPSLSLPHHRGTEETRFFGCPGKTHRADRDRSTGLSLFGVLKQADPALVDPGVTAQLECLLDDVVIGKQEMVSAIDAVWARISVIFQRRFECRRSPL